MVVYHGSLVHRPTSVSCETCMDVSLPDQMMQNYPIIIGTYMYILEVFHCPIIVAGICT